MTGSEKVTRVLVVDDHPLMRDGIAAQVNQQSDMIVVAQAGDGLEAIAQYRIFRPDVILMDLQMPRLTGLQAIAQLRGEFGDVPIVVLTTYKGDVQALKAIKAGARGYLLKSALQDELITTIRSVTGGRSYIYPEVASDIASHLIDDALTDRETSVLACVAAGNANKIVARELNISEETVKAHMKSIMLKLKARDRTHAVAIAVRRGIVDI